MHFLDKKSTGKTKISLLDRDFFFNLNWHSKKPRSQFKLVINYVEKPSEKEKTRWSFCELNCFWKLWKSMKFKFKTSKTLFVKTCSSFWVKLLSYDFKRESLKYINLSLTLHKLIIYTCFYQKVEKLTMRVRTINENLTPVKKLTHTSVAGSVNH